VKKAILAMLVVLAALGIAALRAGPGVFTLGVRSGVSQLLKLLPVLLIAMLLAGFVEVLLPKRIVETWLSDASGWRGIGIAWLAGILTPGGGIVGLPLVASLVKAGVGAGVLVTYLTSMALLSFLRVPMETAIVGEKLVLIRLGANFLLPPLAGFLTQGLMALLRR
jgi:uncharacterized membrane protein YraQ (UPF0718 family)